jgi:hypothetical protein
LRARFHRAGFAIFLFLCHIRGFAARAGFITLHNEFITEMRAALSVRSRCFLTRQPARQFSYFIKIGAPPDPRHARNHPAAPARGGLASIRRRRL